MALVEKDYREDADDWTGKAEIQRKQRTKEGRKAKKEMYRIKVKPSKILRQVVSLLH